MKVRSRIKLLMGFMFVFSLLSGQHIDFDHYFKDETMRVDYEHLGDDKVEKVVLDRIYRGSSWAGPITNLIDTFAYGSFRYQLKDFETGQLIFSREFDSNYGEYKHTSFAQDGISKSFHESVLFPLPITKAVLTIEARNKENSFDVLLEKEINPDHREVIRLNNVDPLVSVYTALYNGDSHKKIDVAFIAEGYDLGEMKKFEKDLQHFTKVLFDHEPMSLFQDDFNVWGVFKPSPESGVDQPRHHSFKRTNIGASFNAFDSERYLLIDDNKELRDIAGHAPYDAIFIIVNHDRYGGAGMYNLYCTVTSDNIYSDFVMIHEFGHSFFGLGDEYYTSDVAFGDLYSQSYEPSSPNITALKDPEKLKWKHLMEKGTPLPTPWPKTEYDGEDKAWQAERMQLKERIAQLVREGAKQNEIDLAKANYQEKDIAHSKKMYEYLHQSKNSNRVGAYEGAGYASVGLYRPMMDCLMFTKNAPSFCPVCQDAMKKMIDWYTDR